MRTNLRTRVSRLETKLAISRQELVWSPDPESVQQLPTNCIIVTFSSHAPKPTILDDGDVIA